MLILREESPRSLRSCVEDTVNQLNLIGSSGEDRPRYLLTVLHAQPGISDDGQAARLAATFSGGAGHGSRQHLPTLSGVEHKTCFSNQSLVRQSTQYLRLTP